MYEFHRNKSVYFDWQYFISRDYVIPFCQPHLKEKELWNVLEIGCGEAGVLKAFLEQGHQCMGIELSEGRIENAKRFLAEWHEKGQVEFICRNIYDIDPDELPHRFDLIVLKDVIEHIPEQEKFIPFLKRFLNPGGKVFFGFPPWQMPFGGHQQMCSNKILSKLPWYHLLPTAVYRKILQWGKESEPVINELIDIKETGISVERFERIVRESDFHIIRRRFYFTNPIYQYKFKLKVREQSQAIWRTPILRNYLSTAVYYLVG